MCDMSVCATLKITTAPLQADDIAVAELNVQQFLKFVERPYVNSTN